MKLKTYFKDTNLIITINDKMNYRDSVYYTNIIKPFFLNSKYKSLIMNLEKINTPTVSVINFISRLKFFAKVYKKNIYVVNCKGYLLNQELRRLNISSSKKYERIKIK